MDGNRDRIITWSVVTLLMVAVLLANSPAMPAAANTSADRTCWNAWQDHAWKRVVSVCTSDAQRQEQSGASDYRALQGEENLDESGPDTGPDSNIPMFQNLTYAGFFICGVDFARVAYAMHKLSSRSLLVQRAIALADRAFRLAEDPAITPSQARIDEVERVRDLLSYPSRFFSRGPNDLGMISDDLSYLSDY